eukprot:CAMPEP_0185275388 /NCGR_PEP_ID=MMETSP1359-20130426/53946_1 /TAXON_ID=552665 /ORGANISM="Bigelowiella longifila, Strain CCMP242" /LENGTH=93 /DNA_ID=CAMNT_0027868729 /DNA_START=172 /DNA_END=450 /DNA_ORIENTATION=+
MASGVKVDKKSFATYDEEMKKKKKYKFMLFELTKKFDKVKLIDLEKGDKKCDPTYEDFVKALCVDGQPRWGIFDYEAKKKDGAVLQKLVLISW